MRKRMNFHGLADAKRLSREGGNLQIYSKIYSQFTFYRLGGTWF